MKINQHRCKKMSFVDKGSSIYSGETIIDQFSIGTIEKETSYSNDSTKFKIIVKMSRIPTNQLLTTFFPTVILWFFGYSTLLIDPTENGFDNRFTGTSTALLVLATLITAVKSDLPNTAYMKFIDIWFLWHVLSVFIGIVCHIALDRVRKSLHTQSEAQEAVDDREMDSADSTNKNHAKTVKNINKALIVLFLALNVAFYMVYFYVNLA